MELLVHDRCPFLVDDLVPLIVDQFALDSSSKDTASLALISAGWLNPVRRALYASPRLHSYHACYLLSRTLADKPELGNCIHALRLHPVSRACSSGVNCKCRDVDAFTLNLAPLYRLSNLSEVSVGGDYAIHAEWYLRSFINPQTIQKIRVEGLPWYWSHEVNRPVAASLCWSEALASRLTNLKHLELVNLDLRICDLQAFKPHPPRLETLFFDRVRITNGSLSGLAHNAWKNLRKLIVVISEYRPEYDFDTILAQASDSLLAFGYLIKDVEAQDDLDRVVGIGTLASCISLRDLQLSVPFGIATLRTLSKQLGQLEILRVYGNYEINIEEWATEITDGIFPCLREIHLPIGHEMRRLADWNWPALRVGTIRRACAIRGISFSYAYLSY